MKGSGVLSAMLACVLAGSQAAGAWAQMAPVPSGPATTVVEPPAPLLPSSDRLVASDGAAKEPTDKPQTDAVLKEDGLKRTETRTVVEGGSPAGWVQAYQMVDATGALSAYTWFREGGKPVRANIPGTSETELASGELVLLDGVSVVRLSLKNRASAGAMLAQIETGLPKATGRRGIAPLLPTLFPARGYDAASLRYALGPLGYQALGGLLPPEILGWDKSAEVASANYAGRGGRGTLTLFLYPTPEIAGVVGRTIEQAINQKGPASFGTVKLKRVGPLVAMTSGAWTAAQAQTLVDSVSLRQEVTFQKPVPPEFHAEIVKTVTLLQGIAIFTGIMILAALVIGLFLGGGRAAIRVLQGKPAASEPEFLTIDLSGRPEPLKPSHPE